MEWALLLLLVPAVVAPVVLLFGFAGCNFERSLGEPAPAAPTNLRVTATDLDSITLAWDYLAPPPEAVVFEILHDQTEPPIATDLSGTSHTHPGLGEGTTHAYQVRAVRVSDQLKSDWVPEPPLVATTRKWDPIFSSAGIPPDPQNGVNNANDTLAQRINAVANGGIFVRVTIRGIVNETTSLTAVTVSRAVPAGAVQPWNSAEPPQAVTFGGGGVLNLPGGVAAVSDKISQAVVAGEDLLVALDVANGSGRILRRDVPGAVAFIGNNRAEAALMSRTAGYNTDNNRAYCVELVEVA
jgi:hypothetical protein